MAVFCLRYLPLLSGLIFSLFSCRKDNSNPANTSIKIHILHESLEKSLNRDSIFMDSAGSMLSISRFQYYLSNFRFRAENPEDDFILSDTVFLIKGLDNGGLTSLLLRNITPGKYRSLEFGIGLDPVTNKSGPGFGPLNPGNGMYWSWSDEYKFMVVEGAYEVKNPDASGNFLFHMAGDSCYRQVKLPFNAILGNGTEIQLKCELSALFGKPNPIDFRIYNNISSPQPEAGMIARNYGTAGFFRIYSITLPQ